MAPGKSKSPRHVLPRTTAYQQRPIDMKNFMQRTDAQVATVVAHVLKTQIDARTRLSRADPSIPIPTYVTNLDARIGAVLLSDMLANITNNIYRNCTPGFTTTLRKHILSNAALRVISQLIGYTDGQNLTRTQAFTGHICLLADADLSYASDWVQHLFLPLIRAVLVELDGLYPGKNKPGLKRRNVHAAQGLGDDPANEHAAREVHRAMWAIFVARGGDPEFGRRYRSVALARLSFEKERAEIRGDSLVYYLICLLIRRRYPFVSVTLLEKIRMAVATNDAWTAFAKILGLHASDLTPPLTETQLDAVHVHR